MPSASSFASGLVRESSRSFVRWVLRWFVRSFVHWFVRSFVRSVGQSFIRSLRGMFDVSIFYDRHVVHESSPGLGGDAQCKFVRRRPCEGKFMGTKIVEKKRKEIGRFLI